MPTLSGRLLADLLDRIRNVRLAVIGDFCLDAYLILDQSRSEVSVETGLRTRAVREQRYSPGGAGNVTANLTAFGVGRVYAFGVVGGDLYGTEMRKVLGALGVDASGLLVQEREWSTHVYTKMIREGQELERVDFGNWNALHPDTASALLARLEEVLPDLDGVIINQQVRFGIHSEQLRRGLVDLVRRHPEKPFITDSRDYNEEFAGTIRKLNDREAAGLCGFTVPPSGDVSAEHAREAALELARRWGRPVVLTRGEHGCLVAEGTELHEVPGIAILKPVDTVGAGDSMLSGFAAALAAGEKAAVAAELGSYVAAVTVTKLHVTGTATRDEILAVGTDPDYRYRPELARAPERARRIEGTEIELVDLPEGPRAVRHAIFDHDGTISTLRQGWESIMEPLMVRAVLGGEAAKAEPKRLEEVRNIVQSFIDRTTGVQTLLQMKGLVDIVRDVGLVPEAEILDAHGYKALYNAELIEMANRRVELLDRGALDATDFTVKGAPAFLRELAGRGVTLWLASGTDQADAEREAEALGYATLFQGRIFGAVGDLDKEPKRIVLAKILGEIGAGAAGSVVAFGDGPVELRETVKRGGIAVGIASDELRRWGWNMRKRKRLIEAGAGLLVPDFSEAARLLDLLGFRR